MSEEFYQMNESKDGYAPCCKKCHKRFADGDIGDVKNYPADGRVTVFFTCEDCGEESSFTYMPDMTKSAREYVRILPPEPEE